MPVFNSRSLGEVLSKSKKYVFALGISVLSVLAISGVSFALVVLPNVSKQSIANDDISRATSQTNPTQNNPVAEAKSQDGAEKKTADQPKTDKKNATSAKNTKTSSSSNANSPASTTDTSSSVVCGLPNFSLVSSPGGLHLAAIPDPDDPSSTTACSEVGYSEPTISYSSEDPFCDGSISSTSYLNWDISCDIYSSTPSGSYNLTLTVKGTNELGTVTRSATYTFEQE